MPPYFCDDQQSGEHHTLSAYHIALAVPTDEYEARDHEEEQHHEHPSKPKCPGRTPKRSFGLLHVRQISRSLALVLYGVSLHKRPLHTEAWWSAGPPVRCDTILLPLGCWLKDASVALSRSRCRQLGMKGLAIIAVAAILLCLPFFAEAKVAPDG